MIAGKKVIFIFAQSKNAVIGKKGKLPWNMKSDLDFFKKTTSGNTCVMGRKTWESLPGKLPNRKHVVMSRNANYEVPKGFDLIQTPDELYDIEIPGEIFVIGGANIFKIFEKYADEAYITKVDCDIDGDVIYDLDVADWSSEVIEEIEQGDDNEWSAKVVKYKKAY